MTMPAGDEVPPPEDGPMPLSALRDHGMLWLINRVVFHPRGVALALAVDENGDVDGWELYGIGDEPWRYDDSVAEDDRFAAAEAFLASRRRA
jgi:hypothetical protein